MTLPLPPGDFQAYLFDCDGTIADSMPLHYVAWERALAEWECTLPEDLFYAWGGRPVADIIVDLNEQQGLTMPVEVVARRREDIYQQLLPQLSAVPDVLRHIHDAHGRLPIAVVSGSTRESVTASLRTLDLLEKFDVLVCAGDYARAKPDPEAFLLAAKLLDVPPQSCLVFEDTDFGIQAATAAGMAAVRVPQPRQR
ncbi:HAD family hydrolase [Micromonospora krabiensis]|uniref:Haloacid dehalogenase superfamily, subfamily IA, variant 3 with third motif having DD or ED n=1 Tax=Micromonospora krabiensis TaxID=307121 RepID=A0A1C3N8G3_9ACTN|nr:HAD-IA family hydrolase [Micromonospora krabiensis]SBV28875.1 haloacid dehalogenase superfamily, subfamily IA, variant 3 with third motif having DD or ED [Micromonospora krabiensis]